MRGPSIFILQLAGCIVVGALIAYPVYFALDPFFDFKFHRVASRCMMLCLLLSIVYVLRHAGVADRRSLGYAEPRGRFWAHVGQGALLGTLMMIPLLITIFALGLRMLHRDGPSVLGIISILIQAAGSGIIVGFIEETYFRGAMYSATARERGAVAAVLSTSAVYAVLHFFGGKFLTRIEDPDWLSGLVIVADAARRFVESPLEIVDSLLALFAAGAILAVVRSRTGAIGWCVGLHAGWVGSIAVTKRLSEVAPEASGTLWIGTYDGVIGFLSLGWMLLIAPLVLLLPRGGGARGR